MDNDMVLEIKAETMQIALTLSSYHDDQPPELGGKSQERSAGGGGGTREVFVCPGFTVCQVLHVSPHYTQVVPVLCNGGSTRKLNLRETTETLEATNRKIQYQICSEF